MHLVCWKARKRGWSMFKRNMNTRAMRKVRGAVAIEALESRCLLSYGLDPSFGTGGMASVWFSGGRMSPAAIAGMPDGRIYLLAYSDQYSLARLLPDGQLDPTFGTGGTTYAEIQPYRNHVL